jgi:hypothetical protein
MLPVLDRLAGDLKADHEIWKISLTEARPGCDPSQITSEALEIACKDLERRLCSASLPEEEEPLSLDAAMKFIRRHTPTA